VLFADAPELSPPHSLAAGHEFLGPVLWEPAADPPTADPPTPPDCRYVMGQSILGPEAKPLIYVTLGSSGRGRLLTEAVRALADLPVTVMAASAGARLPDPLPHNVTAADYLPGTAVARRAALVVCNGGSPSVQQALSAGAPVLGLAGNMDQHLNMRSVTAAGVGLLVRSEHATPPAIAHAARRLLDEPDFRARAKEMADRFAAHDAPATFASAVERLSRQ
jgi:UDP:flavonoid glycosyltransferase YjiC (YdhE family)